MTKLISQKRQSYLGPCDFEVVQQELAYFSEVLYENAVFCSVGGPLLEGEEKKNRDQIVTKANGYINLTSEEEDLDVAPEKLYVEIERTLLLLNEEIRNEIEEGRFPLMSQHNRQHPKLSQSRERGDTSTCYISSPNAVSQEGPRIIERGVSTCLAGSTQREPRTQGSSRYSARKKKATRSEHTFNPQDLARQKVKEKSKSKTNDRKSKANDQNLREEIAKFSETIEKASLLLGKLVVDSEKTEETPERDCEPVAKPKQQRQPQPTNKSKLNTETDPE